MADDTERLDRAPTTYPAYVRNDPYWQAALHILASDVFANDPRVWRHVDFAFGIDYRAILRKGGWSGGQRRLLSAAAGLWNAHNRVDLVGTASDTMGHRYWRLFVEALAILRAGIGGRVDPDEVEALRSGQMAREDLAARLLAQLDADQADEQARTVRLSEAEATAVAQMLRELHAIVPGENLGALAFRVAGTLTGRAGASD